jgi:Spy/CpxP family protein refolding chaperone
MLSKTKSRKAGKKIILSAIAIAFFATTGFSQDIPERKADHPPMMHKQKGDMKARHGMDMKELNLTDAQKGQMKTQREDFHKKMEDLKKNDGITVKEWRSKMESLKNEQKTKIESILTKEQKDKMQQMKTEGGAKHKEMAGKRAGMMKEKLGLSDEQSAKLDKNRSEMMEKMKTIRENKSLSDEQRQEQMKELHKKQKDAMKSILTEEQLKKMKESNHQKGPHGPQGEKKKPEVKTTV